MGNESVNELSSGDKREIINSQYKEGIIEEQVVYVIQQLENIRVKKKISFFKLSELSGLSVSYLYQFAHGRVQNIMLSTLLKLCEALEVNIFDILPDEAKESVTITGGDLFDEITRNMTPYEKNQLLEMIRNMRSLMGNREIEENEE